MTIQQRNYIDNAPAMVLNGSINNSTTTAVVVSSAGVPAVPFYATIDLGSASAEQVLVTAIAGGTTLTITRNVNGLGAFSHTSGVSIYHTSIAQDYSEANAHLRASSAVHGLTGSVVGTTDTQTLTGKSLTAPAITGSVTGNADYAANSVTTVAGVTVGGNVAVTGNETVGGTLAVTGALTAGNGGVCPPGAVTAYAGSGAIPTGWLKCDGSAVSRATYAALFTAIGTTYGTGDGSTTFNLPQLGGKFVRGSTSGDIGTTGGSTTHQHPLSDQGHAKITLGSTVFQKAVATSSETYDHTATATAFATSTASGSLASGTELGGVTDLTDGRPPFLTLAYIIKT